MLVDSRGTGDDPQRIEQSQSQAVDQQQSLEQPGVGRGEDKIEYQAAQELGTCQKANGQTDSKQQRREQSSVISRHQTSSEGPIAFSGVAQVAFKIQQVVGGIDCRGSGTDCGEG